MKSKVLELFGVYEGKEHNWELEATRQHCPFLNRKCLKNRKSQPEIAIGTCTVDYGKEARPVIICPHRLLERNQIFTDCIHLLTVHEPGNELHIVSEISVPGGSVDYFLVSSKSGKVIDFVGIELQTLDTTGTVWPERQRFLVKKGITPSDEQAESSKTFGMNWKMTAKTILVQLHHKIQTFEHINKHLVLVIQDCLHDYMKDQFSFDHLQNARLGDPMHIHSYALNSSNEGWKLELMERRSTDTEGISVCLGLQASANVDLEKIIRVLETKISNDTLLRI